MYLYIEKLLSTLKVIFSVLMVLIQSQLIADPMQIHSIVQNSIGNQDKIKSIQVLSGGLTNLTYKVSLDNETLVVRLGRKNPEQISIDREREIQFLNYANYLNIAPKVIHANTQSGVLITNYIKGENLTEKTIKKKENLIKIVSNIHKLQQFTHKYENKFTIYHRIKSYIRQIEKNTSRMDAKLIEGFKKVTEIEKNINKEDVVVATHNDLFSANIIIANDKAWFIDWEYANWGNKLADLAYIATADNFTISERRLLLSIYDPNYTEVDLVLLNNLIKQYEFMVVAWSIIQINNCDECKKPDFYAIADDYMKKFSKE